MGNALKQLAVIAGLGSLALLANCPYAAAEPNTLAEAQVDQTRRLTGRVVDAKNEPIVGVNVLVKGTTIGTVTDFDGNYSFDAPADAEIVFSFIGYKSQTVASAGRNTLNVTMQDDAEDLDEVVVVGYGVMRKSDLTGSVSNVDTKELQKVSSVDAAQAMQGRMAGVNVMSASGNPGDGVKVRVRGVGTVNNSDPLYIVDGFPASDISHIAPTDIESMEVLKDASATAIYGSRGANGVILVKTKSGSKDGKVDLMANAYFGFSKIAKEIDMADATQFAHAMDERGVVYNSDGSALDAKLAYILDQEKKGNYIKGTDWFDEIMRVGFTQRYNVSIQGSGEKYNYNHGVTYQHEEGIVKVTEQNKFMMHSNNNYKVNSHVDLGLNMNFVYYKRPNLNNDFYSGALPGALRSDPISAAYDEYTGYYGENYYATSQRNPALALDFAKKSRTRENRFIGSFFVQINDIGIKGLSLRCQYGREYVYNESKAYSPKYYITPTQKNDDATLDQTRTEYDNWSTTNYLSYMGKVNKLNINATLGMELQGSTSTTVGVVAYGVPEDANLQYISAHKDATKFQMSGGKGQNRLMSFYGRLNLSYDSRYMLTATVRGDGSSRFDSSERWGTFPSFAAGWNIYNESFIADNNTPISQLKLRAGWGKVGNQASAGEFGYVSTVNDGYNYVFNKNLVSGAVQLQLPNKELTWESAEQYNVGLDFGFLDNTLTGNVDYFVRKTEDMIISKPIPLYAGKSRPYVNAGTMENKGVEASISYNNHVGDFTYGISINASWIKNEVTSLAGGDPIYAGKVGRFEGYTTCTEEGREIAAFWGKRTDGIIKTQAQLDAYKAQLPNTSAQLGDVAFVDVNNDGKLDDNDNVYLGSAVPKVTGGININLGFRNWDFTAFANYSVGNEIINAAYQTLYNTEMFETNISKDMALNHWSLTNPDSNLPRLAMTDTNKNATMFSDRMVEDGSFLRIKQLQLGYTFNKDLTKRIGLTNARIYASVDNVATITSYSGMDPELYGYNDNPLHAGIDMINYPAPRIFSFGVNLTF